MRRLFLTLLMTTVGAGVILWRLDQRYDFTRTELIDCLGYSLLLVSVILLYYQTKGSLTFERRRASHDFLHGAVTSILEPRERELRTALGRGVLLFRPEETITNTLAEKPQLNDSLRPILLDILNFYERMAIAIRSGVLENDLLYDDQGAQALSFHRWVEPLVVQLRKDYEPRVYVNFTALVADWNQRYARQSRSHQSRLARNIERIALKKRDLLS